MVTITPTGQVVSPQQYNPISATDGIASVLSNGMTFILLGFLGFFAFIIFIWWLNKQKLLKDPFHKEYLKNVDQCKLFGIRYKKEMIPRAVLGLVFAFGVTLSVLGGIYMVLLMPLILFIFMFIVFLINLFNRKPYKIYVSDGDKNQYVGDYYGEFVDSDGFHNFAFFKRRKYFFFPDVNILKVPISKEYKVSRKTTDKTKEKYVTATFSGNPISEGEGVITIKALGIEKPAQSQYFYPVLKDKEGRIIDTKTFYYLVERGTVETGLLYEQTKEYGTAMMKAIKLNPRVNYEKNTRTENVDTSNDFMTR